MILDCPYLCWRSTTWTKNFTHNGKPTGVIYGFFRDLVQLQDIIGAHKFVFCWDIGESKRKELYPEYKANRVKLRQTTCTENSLRDQMIKVRKAISDIGFANNYGEEGIEADDIIASVCKLSLRANEEAVIVSQDEDFYQLLQQDRIWMWKPGSKKAYTENCFRKQFYNISPASWHNVKCLSGCSTDNVKGIKGVGELTAAKYIAGLLPQTQPTYKLIKDQAITFYAANQRAMQLPFPGTGVYKVKKDGYTKKKWDAVMDQYGIKSLKAKGIDI